jgi:hypothetical protein
MPAGRCLILAVLPAAALLVSDRAVSDLLSDLGSTAAGRSTYFGASTASALFDVSVARAGAGA